MTQRFQRFPFTVCCKIFPSTFGTKTTQFLLDPLKGPKCLFRFSLNYGLVSAKARNEVFKTGQENKCSFLHGETKENKFTENSLCRILFPEQSYSLSVFITVNKAFYEVLNQYERKHLCGLVLGKIKYPGIRHS